MGYDPVIVFDWLTTHGTQRADGRYLTLGRRLVDDSHRDTFDRWRAAMDADSQFVVPLGRWDEILHCYGIMLHEFDQWAAELYGWDGYCP